MPMTDQLARPDSPDDDIRLLGRVLGEVVAEQSGADAFERVERVRQLAIDLRRSNNPAHHELADELTDVPIALSRR